MADDKVEAGSEAGDDVLKGATVLLVAEDRAQTRAAAMLIKSKGLELIEVAPDPAAVGKAAVHGPQVVLVDLPVAEAAGGADAFVQQVPQLASLPAVSVDSDAIARGTPLSLREVLNAIIEKVQPAEAASPAPYRPRTPGSVAPGPNRGRPIHTPSSRSIPAGGGEPKRVAPRTSLPGGLTGTSAPVTESSSGVAKPGALAGAFGGSARRSPSTSSMAAQRPRTPSTSSMAAVTGRASSDTKRGERSPSTSQMAAQGRAPSSAGMPAVKRSPSQAGMPAVKKTPSSKGMAAAKAPSVQSAGAFSGHAPTPANPAAPLEAAVAEFEAARSSALPQDGGTGSAPTAPPVADPFFPEAEAAIEGEKSTASIRPDELEEMSLSGLAELPDAVPAFPAAPPPVVPPAVSAPPAPPPQSTGLASESEATVVGDSDELRQALAGEHAADDSLDATTIGDSLDLSTDMADPLAGEDPIEASLPPLEPDGAPLAEHEAETRPAVDLAQHSEIAREDETLGQSDIATMLVDREEMANSNSEFAPSRKRSGRGRVVGLSLLAVGVLGLAGGVALFQTAGTPEEPPSVAQVGGTPSADALAPADADVTTPSAQAPSEQAPSADVVEANAVGEPGEAPEAELADTAEGSPDEGETPVEAVAEPVDEAEPADSTVVAEAVEPPSPETETSDTSDVQPARTPAEGRKRTDAMVREARTLNRNGRTAEAAAVLERAHATWTGNPHVYEALAQHYLDTGRAQQALQAAERAVELRRRRASYRVLLGRAHEQLGNKVEAVEAYTTALQLDGSLKSVRARISALQ